MDYFDTLCYNICINSEQVAGESVLLYGTVELMYTIRSIRRRNTVSQEYATHSMRDYKKEIKIWKLLNRF